MATYTLFFYNSGSEREEHGTHKTLKKALREKEELQEELGDANDEDFEVVVNFD